MCMCTVFYVYGHVMRGIFMCVLWLIHTVVLCVELFMCCVQVLWVRCRVLCVYCESVYTVVLCVDYVYVSVYKYSLSVGLPVGGGGSSPSVVYFILFT